jgi:hypothetical protein
MPEFYIQSPLEIVETEMNNTAEKSAILVQQRQSESTRPTVDAQKLI